MEEQEFVNEKLSIDELLREANRTLCEFKKGAEASKLSDRVLYRRIKNVYSKVNIDGKSTHILETQIPIVDITLESYINHLLNILNVISKKNQEIKNTLSYFTFEGGKQ